MRSILTILGLLIVAVGQIQCGKNSYPIPGGLSYFAFVDKNKTALLKTNDLFIERVDLADSTKVISSKRMYYQSSFYMYDNHAYTNMFEMHQTDGLFKIGPNKLRLTYSSLPNVVDWLEFNNRADEWVNPEQVKFNGKPILRLQVNEPVPSSYLYVLE